MASKRHAVHNSIVFTDLKIPAGRRQSTEGETRIATVIGSVFALMILFSIFEEYSPKRLSVAFYFLFWFPMLAVHELGHALMAKLLGWRVHEIVIGFGRVLWQGTIGGTLIKIKLAPVEGYVLPAPLKPDNVRIKSMLIYAAGPGAEILILIGLVAMLGWDTVFNQSDDVLLVALKSLAVVIVFSAGFNLLPFQSEGAVSDGLGILSSPFMSQESIELRLLTFELREIEKKNERNEPAVGALGDLLGKYPDNVSLQLMYGSALSKEGQDDAARDFVREHLTGQSLSNPQRREWLHLQAIVELDATEPEFLTLDAALQKAFKLTPSAPDLLATKGASLVLRGQNEAGGNMLADAWRSSGGSGDDARMLAYLTIAAHRCRNNSATQHFRQAFEYVNRSTALSNRVSEMTQKKI